MLINNNDVKTLFGLLNSAGYYFQAQTPQQLLKQRKNSEAQTELVKLFGIGDLNVIDKINIDVELKEKLKKEPISITCDLDGNYLIHSRWPPTLENAENYIHIGPESFYLAQMIKNQNLEGKKVIDLGCSSGVLTFAAAKTAEEVLGIDSSADAIETANILREINTFKNVEFINFKINVNETINSKQKNKFDLAVFNPPLGIPEENNSFPHRDGGNLGIEVPFLFIDYARQALKSGGEIWCLIASPVIGGQKPFEKELSKRKDLKISETKIIEEHFNQMVFKSHGYDKLGIERIELTIFKIKKV